MHVTQAHQAATKRTCRYKYHVYKYHVAVLSAMCMHWRFFYVFARTDDEG